MLMNYAQVKYNMTAKIIKHCMKIYIHKFIIIIIREHTNSAHSHTNTEEYTL